MRLSCIDGKKFCYTSIHSRKECTPVHPIWYYILILFIVQSYVVNSNKVDTHTEICKILSVPHNIVKDMNNVMQAIMIHCSPK